MFIVQQQDTGSTRGLYVVFEGPDGSGKSTLSQLFTDKLLEIGGSGAAFLQTFPSKDGPVGQLIRRSFTREVELSEETLGYLMIADGHDRCDGLYKRLETGITVVCDRHPLVSAWAYQTEVFTMDELVAIQQRQRFVEPDVVFILDVPPEVAVERIKARHGLANLVFEKDDDGYRNRLRHRYSGYAALNDHSVVLDGTRPLDELLEACMSLVREHFTEKKELAS